MNTEVIIQNNRAIAIVRNCELLLTDVHSALDLAMGVKYETGSERIVLPKSVISEDFFKLSTCLAGEVLQKFINYRIKAAIVGDFSGYTSKPLHDFIYESNHGKNFFFVDTEQLALARLAAV